jgi:hypothetical protein
LGVEGETVTALSLDPDPPAIDERAVFAVSGAERLENASKALSLNPDPQATDGPLVVSIGSVDEN